MVTCIVRGCTNNSGNNPKRKSGDPITDPAITFHAFPWDKKRKKQWADAINLDIDRVHKNTRVCSIHFPEDMIDRSMQITLLRKHAVPQFFLNGRNLSICPSKSVVVIEETSEDGEIDVEQ